MCKSKCKNKHDNTDSIDNNIDNDNLEDNIIDNKNESYDLKSLDFKSIGKINKKINTLDVKINNITLQIEKTNNILYNLNDNLNIINNKINTIDNKQTIIINSYEKILKNMNIETDINQNDLKENNSKEFIYLKSNTIKNIIQETFSLNKDDIIKYLRINDITGDVNLFKLLYLDNIPKHLFPLQHNGKKNYKYWNNDSWNTDLNGEYIKATILVKNIGNIYLNLNQIDYIKNMDEFINNQTHISKLSEPKYQEKWLNSIKEYI